MGQPQQHQPAQRLHPGVDPVKMVATPAGAGASTLLRQRKPQPLSPYSLDDQAPHLLQGRKSLFVNPWKELTPSDFVVGYARGLGRVRCSTCTSKISAGELQLGAFYKHEDKFTLIRWHHQRCVDAPDCLTSPMDLCGIEDLVSGDLEEICRWLGYGHGCVKDRTWTC